MTQKKAPAIKIAPAAQIEVSELQTKLSKLKTMCSDADIETVTALSKRVENWAAKIAVIGQVKAGKSTFLNSFIGQPEFLPSDVNPWTSVVTNIRINIPSDPSEGAEFEFFSEQDWSEIINGNKAIRDIAEKFLPGFDTELLRSQSEELRDKSQRRLGKHYHSMLGTKHAYNHLTPDILKRYVCAGPGADEGLNKDALGRYAALTRKANIYKRLPEFCVPAIVTDTPGVNDPFLVRDEVTCRSLDDSNLFVVVMSAHQALTDVDIGLIRMLAQQEDNDVIIFLNRIDELVSFETQHQRVTEDVRKRLSDAVPDTEFTILSGSAFMAETCLKDDPDSKALCEKFDSEALATFLKDKYGKVPKSQHARLWMASGLDDVKRALSQKIDDGCGTHEFHQIMGDVQAQISASIAAARLESEMLREDVEKIKNSDTADRVAQLSQKSEKIEGAQSVIGNLIRSVDDQVSDVVVDSASSLNTALRNRVEKFIDTQRPLVETSSSQNQKGAWDKDGYEIDLTPLHATLEADVSAHYDYARELVDQMLDKCMSDCSEIMQAHFDETMQAFSLSELPNESFASTLTLAKKTLKAEFSTERTWAFWKGRMIDTEKTIAALRVLATAEIQPTLDKLLNAFSETQTIRHSAGLERIGLFQRTLDNTLSQLASRVADEKDLLDRSLNDEDAQRAILRNLEEKLSASDLRLYDIIALDDAKPESDQKEAA